MRVNWHLKAGFLSSEQKLHALETGQYTNAIMANDAEALNTIDSMRRRVFLSEAINFIRGSTDSDPSAEITTSDMVDSL